MCGGGGIFNYYYCSFFFFFIFFRCTLCHYITIILNLPAYIFYAYVVHVFVLITKFFFVLKSLSLLFFFLSELCVSSASSDKIWLGLTQLNTKFKWQSTAELVTATNWVNGDPGTLVLSADSSVVMNGSSNWAWKVVSKSDTAGVICQRGESSQQSPKGKVKTSKSSRLKKTTM